MPLIGAWGDRSVDLDAGASPIRQFRANLASLVEKAVYMIGNFTVAVSTASSASSSFWPAMLGRFGSLQATRR
jgi:hypothetical protein